MNDNMLDCAMCTAVDAGSSSSEPWNQSVIRTDDISVFPTRGSLVPGWLLVVPHEHALSWASLPPNRRRLTWEIVRQAAGQLRSLFPDMRVYAFEHGPNAVSTAVGCSVDHVHLHVVPLDFDLVAAAESWSELNWRRISNWSSLPMALPENAPYVATTDFHTSTFGIGDIPSQLFRRIIGLHYNVPYDWRSCDDRDNVVETLGRFASLYGKRELVR